MVKQFRKKPIVIDAYQWHENMGETEGIFNNPEGNPMLINAYYCKTLEGYLHVSDGDWIIKGINGEFYPCKPDIFEKTYEEVNPKN